MYCLYVCKCLCAGYSGTRRDYSEDPQHEQTNMTSDYRESDIAGLTEEEQIELAIRNSLNIRGMRDK